MKNIHVLPTDKPSILIKNIWENTFSLVENFNTNHIDFKANHMYITSDEEIKDGTWVIQKNTGKFMFLAFTRSESYNKNKDLNEEFSKIILTTDQDLIKDGVRKIDDGFLDWFVKNPTCEFVEVETEAMFKGYMTFPESINESPFYGNLKHKIIIPKEEHKQETLEEAISRIKSENEHYIDEEAFELGAKWRQERSYSEKEVKNLTELFLPYYFKSDKGFDDAFNEWFEQFKKK